MSRRPMLALAAAVVALALTGCSELRPGVAAEVGDQTITMDRLDGFAKSLCVYGLEGQDGAPMSVAETRRAALGLLIRSMLAHEYAASFESAVSQADLDQTISTVEERVESLPDEEREQFLDDVRASVEGDQMAAFAVQRQAGTAQPTQEDFVALYAEWADEASVELDPRFGTWGDLDVQPTSGSLSVATESDAEEASGPGARSCG